jgi:Mrp family chromosome partitioning ATPase
VPDNSEQLTSENTVIQTKAPDSEIVAVDANEEVPIDQTQKLKYIPRKAMQDMVTTPLLALSIPDMDIEDVDIKIEKKKGQKNKTPKKNVPGKVNKQDTANSRRVHQLCRQFCLSLFFREHDPVHSLGFTSSIGGEGKSFLALVTAQVLASDSNQPVTLVECNWEHPTLHKYFGIPSAPGLAEWLRGTCEERDIRHQVDDNLTFIPAGNGMQDAVKLLKQVQQQSLINVFSCQNELFIAELPPVLTSGYGSLAARLFESVVIVVRDQSIPDYMVAETCAQLEDLPIHGIVLNQMESHIPRWILQLL